MASLTALIAKSVPVEACASIGTGPGSTPNNTLAHRDLLVELLGNSCPNATSSVFLWISRALVQNAQVRTATFVSMWR